MTAPWQTQCRTCGAVAPTHAQFCSACGAALTSGRGVGDRSSSRAPSPSPDSNPTPTVTRTHSNTAAAVLLAGAVGLVVGAFMPWATAGPFSKAGTDGDGVITLVLGALIGVTAFFGLKAPIKPARSWLVVLMTAVAGLVAIYDTADVARVASESSLIQVEVGSGLYLSLLGVGLAVVGLCIGAARRSMFRTA